MKSHNITGGGGIQLHLVETGNSSGRPIIFIHGLQLEMELECNRSPLKRRVRYSHLARDRGLY